MGWGKEVATMLNRNVLHLHRKIEGWNGKTLHDIIMNMHPIGKKVPSSTQVSTPISRATVTYFSVLRPTAKKRIYVWTPFYPSCCTNKHPQEQDSQFEHVLQLTTVTRWKAQHGTKTRERQYPKGISEWTRQKLDTVVKSYIYFKIWLLYNKYNQRLLLQQ